jgi:hydroxylaminobenzene mutase
MLAGVGLFAVGLFTGIWSAAALAGVAKVMLPRLALAAHLNALLGGLWLLGVAVTIPYLNYGAAQLRRLFWITNLPAWSNWAVTLVASCLGVTGLSYNADFSNNAVAFLLQMTVVVPSLLAGVYWLRGFLVSAKE